MTKNNKVAFIGAGMIGSGIAINCITNNVPVVLQGRKQDSLDRAKARMDKGIAFFINAGIISDEQAAKANALISYTTSVEEAVSNARVIQESIPDNLQLKQEMVDEIEKYTPADAIIASSTSSLRITDVFAKAKHPGRGMGAHPYNPAHLIPLVELTKGEKTSDEFVLKARKFYEEIGKEPVVLNRETIGFIANRFQSAIHREVVDLVDRGVCSVEDADKALVYSVGLRWSVIGQYLTMHLGALPEGIGGFNQKFHIDPAKPDGRLSDMPTWTTYPADWTQKAEAGIKEAIAHRPAEMGNDADSIAQWRDKMLVEVLRLHKKL